MEIILYNGVSVASNKIEINPSLPFFNYGLGFFETILYHNSKLYRFDMHIDRLKKSLCKFNGKVNFSKIDEENIIYAIKSSKKLSGFPSLRIKIFAAPMENEDNNVWSIVVTASKFDLRQEPIFAVIDGHISDGLLKKEKSINYFGNIATLQHHKNKNSAVNEVFFINKKRKVIEGTYSNVLCVQNGNLYVVDNKEPYLEGITQKFIIKQHADIGFKNVYVKRKGFSEDFLKKCDEIMITSSLSLALKVEKLRLLNGKVITKPSQFWAEKTKKYLLAQPKI